MSSRAVKLNHIVFNFDAAEINAVDAVRKWIKKIGRLKGLKVSREGASVVVTGADVVPAIKKLEKNCGPANLLTAVVPDEHGGIPRFIRGLAFKLHQDQVREAKGRKLKLNALPAELGAEYFQRMTDPDRALDD